MKHTLILILVTALSLGLMACSSGGGPKVCRVTCTATADCPQGVVCDVNGTKECVQCLTDANCPATTYKGGCDTSTHTCNECRIDSDCGTGSKSCNTASGRCKMCTKGADCTGIMTGKCSADFICDGCTEDLDCNYSGSTAYNCGPKGTCGTSCKIDDDCPIGFSCNGGTGECSCNDDAACKDFNPDSKLTWICD